MASIRPEKPPMVNMITKPIANSIGVSKVIAPRHMVVTQLKTFTPVGMAISMVAYRKYSSPPSGMPTVNMWCAHTMNERKAVEEVASDLGEAADGEHDHEADREQHRRLEGHRAAPHGGDPVEDLHAGRDGDQHGGVHEVQLAAQRHAHREHVVRPHDERKEGNRGGGV